MAKKWLCLVLICLFLIIPALVGASNFYLFPDSDKTRLTYEEVWAWQYDALGYAFNELFARYGRPFEPGGKYDNYFQCQTWYRVDPSYPWEGSRWDDGPRPNNIEWSNYVLIKQVRDEMKKMGTTNPGGKSLPRVFDDRVGSLSSFKEVHFDSNQKLKVFDGPGKQYRRGAEGKAVASTNGRMYAAGWESGWLMVMYQVNNGGVRVGFASPKDFKDKPNVPQLSFADTAVVILRDAKLTEDPVMALTQIANLPQGTSLTWLSRFYTDQQSWDYVEVQTDGQLMRGFLPQGIVDLGFMP